MVALSGEEEVALSVKELLLPDRLSGLGRRSRRTGKLSRRSWVSSQQAARVARRAMAAPCALSRLLKKSSRPDSLIMVWAFAVGPGQSMPVSSHATRTLTIF